MLTRTLTVSTIVVVGLCAGVAVASADDWWDAVDCDQVPQAQCDVEVGDTAQSHQTQPSAPDKPHNDDTPPTCAYQPSAFQGHPDATSWPPLAWYEGTCDLTGVIVTPLTALTPAQVARLARNQLRLPLPQIGSNPAGDQLVNLPTWLYLAGEWQPRSATASVPGISVTATASPASVTWSMGDGTSVECRGPGTDYRGSDPRAESPQCGHTYRRSSGHTTFPVAATIHWRVTWSGAGQTGTLPELTTTSTAGLRVRESQALNVSPPTR